MTFTSDTLNGLIDKCVHVTTIKVSNFTRMVKPKISEEHDTRRLYPLFQLFTVPPMTPPFSNLDDSTVLMQSPLM